MNSLQFGLLLIEVAWLIQLGFIFIGNRNIQPAFVAIYAFGVVFVSHGSQWDMFQIATLISSMLVFISLLIMKDRER